MHTVTDLAAEITSLVGAIAAVEARTAAVVAQRDEAVAKAADLQAQLAVAKAEGTISDDLFAQLDGSVTTLNSILAPAAPVSDAPPVATDPTDPPTPDGETPVPTA